MKIRPVFVGLLAGVMGIVLLVLYMRRFEQDASGGRRIALLVAAAPIERGKPITDAMIGTREVPQAYVDDRAIRATDRPKILGLKATNNVPVAQTIIWTDVIAMTDDFRDLSSLVQPGNRAMPIRVTIDDEITLIHPGDFVDIINVLNETKESSVLLQRVLVLATGTKTADDRAADKRFERATTLTLSVSLSEGQLLALAMEKGKLTAVIRNPDDQRVSETPPDLLPSSLGDPTRRSALPGRRRVLPTRIEVERDQR
ncbi:MAG: Flp pilus assembly protein CpaB [Polyangiaceae bacterium]|nr:Flp pilus assembly protein CpaB [Polyangiaceae bacterium]